VAAAGLARCVPHLREASGVLVQGSSDLSTHLVAKPLQVRLRPPAEKGLAEWRAVVEEYNAQQKKPHEPAGGPEPSELSLEGWKLEKSTTRKGARLACQSSGELAEVAVPEAAKRSTPEVSTKKPRSPVVPAVVGTALTVYVFVPPA